jgi:hypothetical protein
MGWVGPFKFWENPNGFDNLLSFAQMEKQGYEFVYRTGCEWVAYMPDGGRVEFKLDTGVCDRMPYIDFTRLDEHLRQSEATWNDSPWKKSTEPNRLDLQWQ